MKINVHRFYIASNGIAYYQSDIFFAGTLIRVPSMLSTVVLAYGITQKDLIEVEYLSNITYRIANNVCKI